ncbi:MAG TPA: tryptophan synthase subunit alpha, partial [Rhodoferax sp.]|nr:tryptophan synthase subunit alpha [Rhodoferax sp.]
MSRIASKFADLKTDGRKALIPFVTAGYPFADVTPELMHGMVAGGADVIELGVPFSDPSADGPVIQKAGDKALAFDIGLVQVLAMVREFRRTDTTTPVVLMGYANPVERYDQKHAKAGAEAMSGSPFVQDAAAAGVDGVLIVDYPPEECEAFAADLRAHHMDLIFLLAPTSTDARMAQVARVASGYVYYVS